MGNKVLQINTGNLFEKISSLIELSRQRVKTAVNTTMVYTYYHVGQYIVEEEQQGEQRAEYGKTVLKDLSKKLTVRFGEGWSVETLKKCRMFFCVYSKRKIGATVSSQLKKVHSVDQIQNCKQCLPNSDIVHSVGNIETDNPFTLSWSHYLILMRIENTDARSFYEIECKQQDWSVRQLSRQVNSSLYERLALSRNKDEVMRLATKGQTIEKPSDIIKNPITLEFLGLRPDASYSESKLEITIIATLNKILKNLQLAFCCAGRRTMHSWNSPCLKMPIYMPRHISSIFPIKLYCKLR